MDYIDYSLQLRTTEDDAVTLLAMGTPESFPETREKALLALTGAPGRNAREAIELIIKEHASNPAAAIALNKSLLSKELSPYEVVGKLKDWASNAGKGFSGTEMTEAWTQLSMALALVDTPPEALLHENYDLERELTKNAIAPKAQHLKKSCEEDIAQASNPKAEGLIPTEVIDGRYHVTRPHLKDSGKVETNWAEILGNLPQGNAAAALCLLQGSKEKPTGELAAQKILWPEIGVAETENRRLNALLTSLSPRPKGRARTLGAALATRLNAPESVDPPPDLPETRRQTKRLEKMQAELERWINFDANDPKNNLGNPDGLSMKLGALQKLYMLRSTLHPAHQESFKNMVLDEVRMCEAPGFYCGAPSEIWALAYDRVAPGMGLMTTYIERPKSLQEKVFIQTAKDHPRSPNLQKYLREGMSKEAIREAAEHSPKVRAYASKELAAVEATLSEDGPRRHIIRAALGKEPVDHARTFGPGKSALVHIAAWWRGASVLEVALKARTKLKLDPLPKNGRGTNPAFYCVDATKAQTLEAYDIDPETRNGVNKSLQSTSRALGPLLAVKAERKRAARVLAQEDTMSI
jgi:hypothetical protein